MPNIQRKKVDNHYEDMILSYAIMDTDFLRQYKQIHQPNLLSNQLTKQVLSWCIDYYDRYGEAPQSSIEDIYYYKIRHGELPDEIAETMANFLTALDKKTENGEFDKPNTQLIWDETENYLNRQNLEALKNDIETYISTNNIQEARKAISNFGNVELPTTHAVDPFNDEELVRKAFESRTEPLYRFPGAWGGMLNQFLCRESLVGYMAPEKSGKCLPASEHVFMSNGEILPIGEVIQQKRTDIISFNETTESFESDNVSEFWYNGIKPTYTVTTKTGRRVTVTGNHPFYTPDGWKNLENIQQGEYIAAPKQLDFFGTEPMLEHEIKLLAYIIAEGHTRSKESATGFTNTNPDIKHDFTKCVEHMGDHVHWATSDPSEANIRNSKKYKHKQNANNTRKLLKHHNMVGKLAHEKEIPNAIFKLPKDQLSLFLSVLFTCDGGVFDSERSHIGIAMANEKLIRQIHWLLTRFGIVAKVWFKENKKRGAWILEIRDYESIQKFKDEIGFQFNKQKLLRASFQSKSDKWKSFLDKFPWQVAKKFLAEVKQEFNGRPNCGPYPKNSQFYKKFGQNKAGIVSDAVNAKKPVMRQSFRTAKGTKAYGKYMNNKILWDEVTDISYNGKEETYDLTVPHNHSFIAENIVVHNTFSLIDHAFRACSARNNVAYFALGDMTVEQITARMGIYITRRNDNPQYCKPRLRPVLDCKRNQQGTCRMACRTCRSRIIDDEGNIADYWSAPKDYIPCDKCSHDPHFEGTYWFEWTDGEEPLTWPEAYSSFQWWHKNILKGHRFKLVSYPFETCSVADIETELKIWEQNEGWVPDVVIIDYADNLAPEPGDFNANNRDKQCNNWGAMSGLRQRWHNLVLTATQTDKHAYEQGLILPHNFSEDKRKFGHATAMVGLNSLPMEKELGLVRNNIVMVREGESNPYVTCTAIQHLYSGRPFVDSFMSRIEPE